MAILALGIPSARAEPQGLDPDSERIMQVLLSDGTGMTDALVIYPTTDNDWMLPLGELSEALGLAIRASAALGIGEGFIIQEARTFRLETATCRVQVNYRTEKFDCRGAVVHQDDIFVDRRLLQKWLPINIRINSLRSQILIYAREKLPLQLKREREAQADRSRGMHEDFDPGYPREETPYSIYQGPLVDEQLTLTQQASSGVSSSIFGHSTQMGGELLGLESYAFFAGTQHKLTATRFNFARRSAEGKLLGPAKLTEIQLVDLVMPQLPLISDVKPARGILASSFPLQMPSTFERTSLEGPLTPGWEVELYRNGVLLDRAVSDERGRYIFRDIPLFYGKNLMRLAFYGPQGERRDEYKTYHISPGLVLPDSTDYRFAIGQLENRRTRGIVQASQNISKVFTMTAGAMHDTALGSAVPETYGYLGLTGFNELFLFQMTCAFASIGGKACEWGQQIGYENISGGWKYTRLFQFQSGLFPNSNQGSRQESQTSANVGYVFPVQPGIGFFVDVTKKNFENQISQSNVRGRLAFSADRLYWNNDINYEFGIPNPIAGRWELTFIPSEWRFGLGLDYNQSRVTSTTGEIVYTSRELSVSSTLRYQHDLKQPSLQLSASRYFPSISPGLTLNYTDTRNYSASLIVTFSIARDPYDGGIHISRDSMVSYGAASVSVFLDKNRNGTHDPGEPGVPGIAVSVNQKEVPSLTNSDGVAFVSQLRPHQPSDLAIALRSLKDPFLRPTKTGVRIVGRPGKTAKVELPLAVSGEIDGYITVSHQRIQKTIRGVEVELVDVSGKVVLTAKTDREGFYTLENVPPGTYTLRISPAQIKASGLRSEPKVKTIVMPEEGAFETNHDFALAP